MAPDIGSLLRLGRQQDPAAGLFKRLEYLHQSCTAPVTQQSDLFRLTHAIEHLRSQGWINVVVADDEWKAASLYTKYANVSALLVRKSKLQRHFTDEGKQSAPVDFMMVGDGRVVGDVLDARELRYTMSEQHAGWCLLSLLPSVEALAAATLPESRVNAR